MNITQLKVKGYENTVDIKVAFSENERKVYSPLGWATQTEIMSLRNGKTVNPISGIFSVDQIQGNNYVSVLGFGSTDSEQAKNNFLVYSMKINEVENGKQVAGSVTYKVEKVVYDGKEYVPNKESIVNGLPLETTFLATYESKSAKNSTLYQHFRNLVKVGYINFLEIPSFLQAVETKKEEPKAPKEIKKRKTKAEIEAEKAKKNA